VKDNQILKFFLMYWFQLSTRKLQCVTSKFLDCFTLGDGTGSLSRVVGNKLPSYDA